MGELQARMSAREFVRWQIYDRYEPVGTRGEAWRFAALAAAMLDVLRDPKQHPDPLKPEQFLAAFAPDRWAEAQPASRTRRPRLKVQPVNEMRDNAAMLAAALGWKRITADGSDIDLATPGRAAGAECQRLPEGH